MADGERHPTREQVERLFLPAKELVLTVHGVNSDGGWQTEVRQALEPHFECREVMKYDEYRNLGLLALILEPRILLALLVVTYALAFLGTLKGPALFAVPGASLLLAIYLARLQRGKILKRFEDELLKIVGPPGYVGPHVIAHCFGTYLAGWALRFSESLRFDNMILAGSVLPSQYDWAQLAQEDRRAFGRLRNEIGRWDWFTWLIIPSFLFCPDLGWSGTRGFRVRQGSKNVVDNVPVREVTRNDRFIQATRVRRLWRPFLWGIDPGEYQKFTDLCSVAARMARANPSDPQVKLLDEELGSTHWKFLERTLYKEISEQVPWATAAELVYAVGQIRINVALALQEEANGSRNEEVLQFLKLQVAIRSAVTLLKRSSPPGPAPAPGGPCYGASSAPPPV
jgi:hypothetical protein